MNKMTKEELVELIKENFRDEDGDIDLNSLDFSNEPVFINEVKAKCLDQSIQQVKDDLYQNYQNVGGVIYQDETKMKPR